MYVLNFGVCIFWMICGSVLFESVFDMGLFDYDKVESLVGWICEFEGEYILEMEEYGILSFIYCVMVLFDVEKFWDFLNDGENWIGVL